MTRNVMSENTIMTSGDASMTSENTQETEKTKEVFVRTICCFCKESDDNEIAYGKFHRNEEIVTHYFCLLLSSNMEQNGTDDQGILGFMPNDIRKELKRGKRLLCSYCKKSGATLGCCYPKCKKVFHLPCGLREGSLHQFFGAFKSFCVSHRPIQKVDKKFLQLPVEESVCAICLENVICRPCITTLCAPCCSKSSWFHRSCVQLLALSAGYFFKCPLCNNKNVFQDAMLISGIYVPDRDASWELVPHAYEELLHRHNTCDAARCQCSKGREYDSQNTKFELILCKICGSQGSHVACANLSSADSEWSCPGCSEIVSRFESPDSEGTDSEIDVTSEDVSSGPPPTDPRMLGTSVPAENSRSRGLRRQRNTDKSPSPPILQPATSAPMISVNTGGMNSPPKLQPALPFNSPASLPVYDLSDTDSDVQILDNDTGLSQEEPPPAEPISHNGANRPELPPAPSSPNYLSNASPSSVSSEISIASSTSETSLQQPRTPSASRSRDPCHREGNVLKTLDGETIQVVNIGNQSTLNRGSIRYEAEGDVNVNISAARQSRNIEAPSTSQAEEDCDDQEIEWVQQYVVVRQPVERLRKVRSPPQQINPPVLIQQPITPSPSEPHPSPLSIPVPNPNREVIQNRSQPQTEVQPQPSVNTQFRDKPFNISLTHPVPTIIDPSCYVIPNSNRLLTDYIQNVNGNPFQQSLSLPQVANVNFIQTNTVYNQPGFSGNPMQMSPSTSQSMMFGNSNQAMQFVPTNMPQHITPFSLPQQTANVSERLDSANNCWAERLRKHRRVSVRFSYADTNYKRSRADQKTMQKPNSRNNIAGLNPSERISVIIAGRIVQIKFEDYNILLKAQGKEIIYSDLEQPLNLFLVSSNFNFLLKNCNFCCKIFEENLREIKLQANKLKFLLQSGQWLLKLSEEIINFSTLNCKFDKFSNRCSIFHTMRGKRVILERMQQFTLNELHKREEETAESVTEEGPADNSNESMGNENGENLEEAENPANNIPLPSTPSSSSMRRNEEENEIDENNFRLHLSPSGSEPDSRIGRQKKARKRNKRIWMSGSLNRSKCKLRNINNIMTSPLPRKRLKQISLFVNQDDLRAVNFTKILSRQNSVQRARRNDQFKENSPI